MSKTSETSQTTKDLTDDVTNKVLGILEKQQPVQKIRNSQFLSAILAAAGLALFLVGVEKVFIYLSGWTSIGLGLLLLAVSGTLFTKLK
jgi:hypothetical protein